MAMRNMGRAIPKMFKDGYKQMTGVEEAIIKNCEAGISLAEVVRTSFGPNGLSKIIINRIEKVFITTDCATIIGELEVQHPAAKVLCLAAQMQQQEIGDGANFVVMFAGELLKGALSLLRIGIHPADLVRGYTFAGKKVQEILSNLCVFEVNDSDLCDKEKLMMGIKSCISSKQYGIEDVLASLVADACLNSMPSNPKNFIVDNIRTVKILGSDVHQSEVVRGMVIDVVPRSSTRRIESTKVAVFTCAVDWTQTETKGTVLMHNAEELLGYNRSEEEHMHGIIRSLHEMGVGIVITNEKLGEVALHFLDKYHMVALKLISKWNIRRLCRTLRARPLVRLTQFGEEDFGYAQRCYTKEIGAKMVTVFEQGSDRESEVSTIVLRGATEHVLSDLERAIDDGVNVVRSMTRDGKFVAGAGACEIELARCLKKEAMQVSGLEQYAIEKYAEALEVIPRTLAENTGLKDTDIIAKLYAAHEEGDVANNEEAKNENENGAIATELESDDRPVGMKIGVDIEKGVIRDMTSDGVIDLMSTRQMGLTLATQAAVTILRVDHIIMKKPAGGPKMPKRGHWDAQDDTW